MPLNLNKENVPERALTKRRKISKVRERHPRTELVTGLRTEGGPGRELPDSNSKRVKEYLGELDAKKQRLQRLRPEDGRFWKPTELELDYLNQNGSVSVYGPGGKSYYTIEVIQDPGMARRTIRVSVGNAHPKDQLSSQLAISDEELAEATVVNSLIRWVIDRCLKDLEDKIDEELS